MIKVDNSGIEINGIAPDVLSELTTIVHHLHYDCIVGSDKVSPEESRKLIMEAVELGFSSDEEVAAKAKESKERIKADVLRVLDELANILKGKDDE